MKKRNKQIANLLKLSVFLFGFSLLLWNCQDETIEKQENNIATVGLEEALNLFKANSSAKLRTNTYFVAHLEKIHQEDIINSTERLTIIPVSTKDSGYYSRIVLLKVNGNIQSVIFSMYPSSTKKETNGFTGEIIITDLEGNFLKGYRANSGNLITKFTKKVLSVNKSSKGGVCPDHGECTANSLCVYCTQELDEVVVSGNTSGGSAPVDYILDFSGTESGDGSSGDPNTSMGWDYGDGGGGTSSNTAEDQIVNKLTGKALCLYNKLRGLNLFKTTINKFENSESYNLIIEQNNTCGSGIGGCTDSSDIMNGNIKINMQITASGQPLNFAAALLHEGIHAELFKYVDEHQKGLDPNSRKNLLEYYFRYKGDAYQSTNAQHQHMADNYVKPIAEAIRKLDNYSYPLEYYMGFGWDGLRRYGYDGYYDEGKWTTLDKNSSSEYYKNQKIVNDNTKINGNECK